jgi:porphobilinogen deaminase
MNVDSLDGLIVAKAALNRLNIQHQNMYTFSEDQMLPAAAQGAIGIEINAIELESDIGNLLKLLNDESTYQATAIERTVVASLEGNCLSPISALCKIEARDAELKVMVSTQNGSKVYNEAVKFNLDNKIDALQRFIETLIQNGAKEIIQQ